MIETDGCCEKKIERSEAVSTVFDLVKGIMWKIVDCDGAEKQQDMALKLFQFLGKAKDLEEVAQKLVSLAMKSDEKKEEDTDGIYLE